MSSNQTERNPASAQGSGFKGYPQLGIKRQQWLREELGIQSPQEMARASVNEIDATLKAKKQRLARNIIEDWIEQAKTDVAAAELASTQSPLAEQAGSSPEAESHESTADVPKPTAARTIHEAASTQASDWQLTAAFIVEFQERIPAGNAEFRTRAYQIEVDTSQLHGIIDNGAVWPGLEREQLCQWMSDRVTGSDLAKEQDEPSEIQRLDEPSLATIVIKQIRFFQPLDARTPVAEIKNHQPLDGTLKRDEPFAIEIVFDIAGGESVARSLDRTRFYGQVFTHNKETRQDEHLGNTTPQSLSAENRSYTTRLPAATLAGGEYRISILVKFKITPPIIGHIEIPSLYVI